MNTRLTSLHAAEVNERAFDAARASRDCRRALATLTVERASACERAFDIAFDAFERACFATSSDFASSTLAPVGDGVKANGRER